MNFIHENFLLHSRTAENLYHSYACDQPILDYHSHLPPADIATNRKFANLFEIWLEGDHYKWRAMRANGVADEFCTGNALHTRNSRHGRERSGHDPQSAVSLDASGVEALFRNRRLAR